MVPLVVIFSDEKKISIELTKELVTRGCLVITPSQRNWQKFLINIRKTPPNYIFVIDDHFHKRRLQSILDSISGLPAKTSFIFQNFKLKGEFERKISEYSSKNMINPNIIYIEEKLGQETNLLSPNNLLERLIKNTFSYWEINKVTNLLVFKNNWFSKITTKQKKFKIKKRHKVFFISAFLALFIGVMTPYIFLFWGTLNINFAYKNFLSGNLDKTKKNIATSATLTGVSGNITETYMKIPVIGFLFSKMKDLTNILERTNVIIQKGVGLFEKINNLVGVVFGSEEHDLNGLSKDLSLDLESLYKETSFLQIDLDKIPSFVKYKTPLTNTLSLYKKYILEGEKISQRLPYLLGNDKTKTYLILFQNNMELRPTGGFIGSFSLVKFSKGKMVDMPVYDVYTADGQLKGYVEPPTPIRDFLGEANWFLRDSNWDPDFAISAQRAEWFLNKELEIGVDGVVGIDLEIIRSLIKIVGPIKLIDFNQTIDENNMNDVIQKEVERNFFPGSQKKANFLTSLSRTFVDKIKELRKPDYLKIGKALVNSLNSRHVQIFMHDNDTFSAVSNLGWDGIVSIDQCTDNCFNNYLGIVEANVGVNKANNFIEREFNLETKISEKWVENNLVIKLVNTSSQQAGVDYKAYVRVMAPEKSLYGQVKIQNSKETFFETPEINELNARNEAGVFVEVKRGEQSEINFKWQVPASLNLKKNGKYVLTWRKQAGTNDDKVLVNTKFVTASLTFNKESVYNSRLSKDLILNKFW